MNRWRHVATIALVLASPATARKVSQRPVQWKKAAGGRHRMIAAIQVLTAVPGYQVDQAMVAKWRLRQIDEPGNVWRPAIHRVAAEGITSEQAIDEAIARTKQTLSEQPGHGAITRSAAPGSDFGLQAVLTVGPWMVC